MIGIVITGHLQFATGVRSALEAISGAEPQLAFVDFPETLGTEGLEQNLRQAADSVDTGDGVLFLTDIPGGSPFQRAAKVAAGLTRSDVLTGTNLVMAAEACLERDGMSLPELVAHVLNEGHDSIKSFNQHSASKSSAQPAADDGI